MSRTFRWATALVTSSVLGLSGCSSVIEAPASKAETKSRELQIKLCDKKTGEYELFRLGVAAGFAPKDRMRYLTDRSACKQKASAKMKRFRRQLERESAAEAKREDAFVHQLRDSPSSSRAIIVVAEFCKDPQGSRGYSTAEDPRAALHVDFLEPLYQTYRSESSVDLPMHLVDTYGTGAYDKFCPSQYVPG